MKEFPTVFDGQTRTMPGEVFKIETTDGAKPFYVSTPRTIPYAYRPTKDELELLESQGIISKQTEPTDWCAPIVVARKKNSERIRLCVDFSPLNRFVKRERFQSTPQLLTLRNPKLNTSQSLMLLRVIPFGQRQSASHYFHHAVRTLQVHACSVWPLLHQ